MGLPWITFWRHRFRGARNWKAGKLPRKWGKVRLSTTAWNGIAHVQRLWVPGGCSVWLEFQDFSIKRTIVKG